MWVYLAVALAALAVGFGSGWQVRAWKAGSDHVEEVAQAAHDVAVRAEHVDSSAVAHEQYKAAASARERIVYKEVERVVASPVYLQHCFDDGGMFILAADIAARGAPGQPAPAVPAASSPDQH